MRKVLTSARKAFTLIELIVTVVIIGILAGIGLVAYSNITDRAQDTADKTTLESLHREIKIMAAFGTVYEDDVSVSVADTYSLGADDAGTPDVDESTIVDDGDTFVVGAYTLTLGADPAITGP